ncbi:MAG: hypothetical protein WBK28_00085 [Minisyncoccia bacterium]
MRACSTSLEHVQNPSDARRGTRISGGVLLVRRKKSEEPATQQVTVAHML